MEVLWLENISSPHSFQGYSLILPSVSIGNIGQLAIDLLISTLKTEQIAIVHHPALLPLAGCIAYSDNAEGLTTAADLHISHESKLLIIQIRSPVAKGRQKEFVFDLVKFTDGLISDGKLIVLSSVEAANRRDFQMKGGPLRYYPSDKFADEKDCEKLKSLGLPLLESVPDNSGVKKPYFCMSGNAEAIIKLSSLPSVCLLSYVDEGDNTYDASQLAAYFYSWHVAANSKDSKAVSWKYPPSWKNMFGAPTPRSLFM